MVYQTENTYPYVENEKEGSVLLWRKEDDKHILLARHDMYVMNEFSKEIFTLCDGSRSINDLASYCVEKYGVEFDVARDNINELVDFAVSRKLMGVKIIND